MIISVGVVTTKEFATICASCANVVFFANNISVFPTLAEFIPFDRLANWGIRVSVVVGIVVFHVTENDRNSRAVNFYFRFFLFISRTILVPSAFSFSVGIELFFAFFLDSTRRAGPGFIALSSFFYFFYLIFFLDFFYFRVKLRAIFRNARKNVSSFLIRTK